MKTQITRTLVSTSLVLAGAVFAGTPAYAGGVFSDELRISIPGQVVSDQFVAETGAPEPALIFNTNPNGPVNPNLNAGTLSIVQALGIPGAVAVALMEPLGQPPAPGETCVQLAGACISDIIIANQNTVDPVLSYTIALFSDPHAVISDPNLPFAALIPVLETGTLQDLTAILHTGAPGFQIEVMSDIEPVPVPAAAWLFGSALGLIGLQRRKPAAA